MRKRQRIFLGSLFFTMALVLTSLGVKAQPGDPGGNPDVPITGIEILLAAGGFLGIKKLLGKDKKNP